MGVRVIAWGQNTEGGAMKMWMTECDTGGGALKILKFVWHNLWSTTYLLTWNIIYILNTKTKFWFDIIQGES